VLFISNKCAGRMSDMGRFPAGMTISKLFMAAIVMACVRTIVSPELSLAANLSKNPNASVFVSRCRVLRKCAARATCDAERELYNALAEDAQRRAKGDRGAAEKLFVAMQKIAVAHPGTKWAAEAVIQQAHVAAFDRQDYQTGGALFAQAQAMLSAYAENHPKARADVDRNIAYCLEKRAYCALRAGRGEEAIHLYAQVVENYPRIPYASWAMNEIPLTIEDVYRDTWAIEGYGLARKLLVSIPKDCARLRSTAAVFLFHCIEEMFAQGQLSKEDAAQRTIANKKLFAEIDPRERQGLLRSILSLAEPWLVDKNHSNLRQVARGLCPATAVDIPLAKGPSLAGGGLQKSDSREGARWDILHLGVPTALAFVAMVAILATMVAFRRRKTRKVRIGRGRF